MGLKDPSFLGLGVIGRTYVTKANCTPAASGECCGKSFIFNREFLRGYCPLVTPPGPQAPAELHPFCSPRVTIPGKILLPLPFRNAAEYAGCSGPWGKTEFFVTRLTFDELLLQTRAFTPPDCRMPGLNRVGHLR